MCRRPKRPPPATTTSREPLLPHHLNEENPMQTLPMRLHPVVRAIQSSLGRRVLAAVVGLTALGFATLVLSSPDSAKVSADATKAVTPESKAAKTAGVTVSLVAPVSTPFARGIPATGTVAPRDELVIGSDATGVRLVEVLVEVGAVVQRGQLLARGDDSLL